VDFLFLVEHYLLYEKFPFERGIKGVLKPPHPSFTRRATPHQKGVDPS